MEFTLPLTAGAFVALVLVGVAGLIGSGVMAPRTVLMMVLPSMVVFGLICLGLGVKHGEHRAGGSVG